ncbi:hypothetical protein DOE76_09770 [Leifsonia sp. ku-ls]|nr:hypothetical protein DOE76_09770 [Leifsonia sp. ku-ls]
MSRIVPQFVAVAVISAIAPFGLIVAAAVWPEPASRIPAHWDFAGTPSLEGSAAVFWVSLVPALACFGVAIVCAIFLRDDVGRWGTAAGLGALTLAGAFPALIWPVGQVTARMPGLDDQIGAPFLLYGIAFLLGAASFAIAAARAVRAPAAEGFGEAVG